MSDYLGALLDTVEARNTWVQRTVGDIAEELRVPIRAGVVVAARAKTTTQDVVRVLKAAKFQRTAALALVHAGIDADERVHAWAEKRGRAVIAAGGKHPTIGKITPTALEARRAARGDAPPREPPRLQVGGRLPPLDRVVRMTDAELNLLLKRFGLGVDRTARTLEAATRASERLVAATHPHERLIDRVLQQAEASVRRELQDTVKDVLRNRELASLGRVEMLVVLSVLGKTTCGSCEDGHGRKIKVEDYSDDGPGNPSLECGSACLCVCEPAEWFEPLPKGEDGMRAITADEATADLRAA